MCLIMISFVLSRLTVSKLWSFKLRRAAFLNHIEFAGILISIVKGTVGIYLFS